MHGFYQGFSVTEHLIKSDTRDVLLLQERCLTPANMDNFDKFFPNFFYFWLLCDEQASRIWYPSWTPF